MRSRWLWGILALFACACLLVFGMAGGLVLTGFFEEGRVEVRVEPPVLFVAPGQEAQLTLTLTNPGRQAVRIDAIAVPNAWWKAMPVIRSEPAFLRVENGLGERYLIFQDVVIPPGASQRIQLTLRALETGRVQGEWAVHLQDGGVALFQMEGAVEARAGQPNASPAAPIGQSAGTPPAPSVAALAERLARSVVMIVALKIRPDGTLEPVWSGSGTVVDARGYILTNAHVVLDDFGQPLDDLLILVTQQPDQPPEPAYRARVIQADPKLDLAVIKIDRDAQGNPLSQAPDLPAVPLGDSDQLHLGDPLLILGYPGIGGETITLTRGEVSGFTSQPGYGARAWIKTSATIAGGSSGGLAANLQGELVGVPTLVGAGQTEEVVDCRPLVDTNNDGVINDLDTCVPIGGYINALRPVNLARPLIEAALTGQVALPTPRPTGPGPDVNLVQVFYESFDNPAQGYWRAEKNDSGLTRYEQGAFLVKIKRKEFIFWFTYGDQVLRDMAVSVTVRVKKPTGTGDAGVVCREDPVTGDFYAFSISEDGYYSIWMYHQGETQALIQWTRLPRPDLLQPGRPVDITGLCMGPHLVLLVNGEFIAEVQDTTLTQGYGGFLVGTWDTPGFVVTFDDFYLYEIRP